MCLSTRRVVSTHIEKYRWGLNCSLKTLIFLSFSCIAVFSWALQRAKPSSLTQWEKPPMLACILQLPVFAKTEQRDVEGWKRVLLHCGALAHSLCWASPATAAGCTVQSRTHLEIPVVLLLEKHSTKTCALARNVHTSVCVPRLTKFTSRFYLLYHSSSNAAFLQLILDKDLLDLVIFPKSFPLFSMPYSSHGRGHCLGSARLLALTLPAHHSPSWKESLCSQEINRNQYQELSFSINTVTRK